jgi:hypothetical protein
MRSYERKDGAEMGDEIKTVKQGVRTKKTSGVAAGYGQATHQPDPIGEEWRALCKDAESKKDAYLQAFALVNIKFATVPREKPTMTEVLTAERAYEDWRAALKQLHDFARKHAQ